MYDHHMLFDILHNNINVLNLYSLLMYYFVNVIEIDMMINNYFSLRLEQT